MRRILSLTLLSVLLVSILAACGGSTGGTAASTAASTGTAASTAAASTAASTDAAASMEASMEPSMAASAEGAASAEASTAASTAANTGGEKVRLRLATWAGVDEAKELDAILAKLNAESQTFEIVQEAQPADYYTKLQTTIAGGQAADLMWLSQEYIPGYAERGALLDISEALGSSTEAAAKLDDYFPEVLQTAQLDGKTYGLPWISQPVIMYYNPKLFADNGVAEPTADWTWDDFKSAAEKLTKPDQGIYGTAFNDWPPIQMFIWQAGGDVVSEDRTEVPIDTPEALQGIQFYKDIIFNPTYAAPENVIKEQGFGELAKNGKVAMFFGGAADDLDYAHKKDAKFAELKAALVPKGPKSRTTFAWTASTVANAQTANPEVTTDALIKLTEAIHHWKIVAPRKSLANKETIIASVPDKADSADVIVEAAKDMRSFRIVAQQSEWDTIFFEKFKDPLYHDKGDPATLAKDARAELESVLQGP